MPIQKESDYFESNHTNILIDPSLTMDWTTLNPPNLDSIETEKPLFSLSNSKGTTSAFAENSEGMTEAAESPPSAMEAGLKQTSNATVVVVAQQAKEAESEIKLIDTEGKRSDNITSAGALHESEATELIPDDDDSDTDEENLGTVEMAGSETKNDGNEAADLSYHDTDEIHAPSSAPSSELDSSTHASTVPYVEPNEEVEAELETEGFEEGEAVTSSPLDDDDWDGTRTTDDALHREEEEEIKKVRGAPFFFSALATLAHFLSSFIFLCRLEVGYR